MTFKINIEFEMIIIEFCSISNFKYYITFEMVLILFILLLNLLVVKKVNVLLPKNKC
jgi:hypothetical protein